MHCIDDRIRTLPDILLSEKFGVGFESASTDTKVVIKTKPNVRRQTNSRSDNQTNRQTGKRSTDKPMNEAKNRKRSLTVWLNVDLKTTV